MGDMTTLMEVTNANYPLLKDKAFVKAVMEIILETLKKPAIDPALSKPDCIKFSIFLVNNIYF